MPFQFYYDFMSQPSRALYIIFKLSGVNYEDCMVPLRKGVHLSEEFKNNVNRFQKVPCIIEDGFKLAESIAILRYLSGKGQISNALYPRDVAGQARVDEFLEWHHITLRLGCALYFRTLWLEPRMTGKQPTANQIEASLQNMEQNLDIVEQIWLEKTQYLTGNNLTAADIFAAAEIEQIKVTGYVLSKYPKISAWLERVRKECNPHYEVAHKIVYRAAASTKPSKL